MKVEQEKLFIEVATTLNFSKAAERVSVSASAVSKQIKTIEEQLGLTLIVRSSRALRLTEAGEAYLASCIKVQEARDNFKDQLSEIGGEIKGLIRLTCPPVYASNVLIPLLHKFNELHPEIRFQVDTNYKNVDIVTHSYDLAIRFGKLDDSSLMARKIKDFKLYLCCNASYYKQIGPIKNLADLSKAKFIFVEGFELKQTLLNGYFNAFKITPDSVVLATNDTRVQIESVLKGIGVSVLPEYLIQQHLKSGEIIDLLPKMELPRLPLNILYPGQKNIPIRVRQFIEFLSRHHVN